jgi:hypothetical protein
MNGLEIEETAINSTNMKLQFMFKRCEQLDQLINDYKLSRFKEFVSYQNHVKRIIHSN